MPVLIRRLYSIHKEYHRKKLINNKKNNKRKRQKKNGRKMFGIKKIKKSFSKRRNCIEEISLSIDKGEFITLLGSSEFAARQQHCVSLQALRFGFRTGIPRW